jgi:hypothetical protein
MEEAPVSCDMATLDLMNDPSHMPIGGACDLCDTDLDISVSAVLMSGGCIGTWYRTWTATDDCGNSATAEQMIMLEDEIAPEFITDSLPADTVMVYVNYNCDANYLPVVTGVLTSEDADDNCDNCFDQNLVVDYTTTEPVEVCLGDDDTPQGTKEVTRTWTVTDQCENTSEFVQTIFLVDTIAPVGYAYDETVDCAEYRDNPDQVFGTLTLSDNCDTEFPVGTGLTWDVSEDVITMGDLVGDTALVDEDNAGCYTVVRTYYLKDDCGNMSSFEQTLHVEDNTDPLYQGPGEISIPAHLFAEGLYEPAGEYNDNEVWAFAPGGIPGPFTYLDGTTDILTSFPIGYVDDCSGLFSCTAQDYPVSGGCAEQPHPDFNDYESASWMRLITITDMCGNSSEWEVFIHLVDTIAPYFTSVPADYTIEYPLPIVFADAEAADWVDDTIVPEELPQQIIPGNCPGNYQIVRTWKAVDNCGNATTATQTITVQDTTAPVVTAPADITVDSRLVSCGAMQVTGNALRVCAENNPAPGTNNYSGRYVVVSEEVYQALPSLMEVGDQIVIVGATSANQSRTITSTQALPGGLRRLNWGSQQGTLVTNGGDKVDLIDNATATDNCDQNVVPVALGVQSVQNHCDADHIVTYTRSFTATDACGNAGNVAVQTIRLIDNTLPTISAPANINALACTAAIPTTLASASDEVCCDSFIGPDALWYEDALSGHDDECPVEYTITRTHYATFKGGAEGDCRIDTVSDVQIINIVDQVAPIFLPGSTSGLMNGDEVEVGYNSNCGDVSLGDIANPLAEDNCDGSVVCDNPALLAAQEWIGNDSANVLLDAKNIPHNPDHIQFLVDIDASGVNNPFITGGETTSSEVMMPAVLSNDGMTCDNNPNAHGMRMFNFGGGEYYITDEGTMTKHWDDGVVTSATLTMTVSNDMGAFVVEATFGQLMNWVEWCETPGLESFKSDCGLGDHLLWNYAILEEGSITGVEGTAFEGTDLTLSHQPANHYFGFQFGEGANNKNEEYGFSGWFYYGGTLVMDGDTTSAMGSGDLFGDLDFLTEWSTELTYCAVDCAGNSRTFRYTLNSTGMVQDIQSDGGMGGEQDDQLTQIKDLIEITTLYPNPASSHATLTVTVKEDLSAKVHIYTMDGALVEQVFDGQLYEGWPTTLELDVNNLESGMYQIRVSSKDFVTTKKLLVIE